MQLERTLFVVVALAVCSYLLVSIHLHSRPTSNGGSGGPPLDHTWRLEGLAKHDGDSFWNGFKPEVAAEAASSKLSTGPTTVESVMRGLRPGYDVIEMWVRQKRENFPEYFNYGRRAIPKSRAAMSLATVPLDSTEAAAAAVRLRGGDVFSAKKHQPLSSSSSHHLDVATDTRSVLVPPVAPLLQIPVPLGAESRGGGGVAPAVASSLVLPPPLPTPPPQQRPLKVGILTTTIFPLSPPRPLPEPVQIAQTTLRQQPVQGHQQPQLPPLLPSLPPPLPLPPPPPPPLPPTTTTTTANTATVMKIKTRPPSKCLLFTMDSIDSYVQRSKHGGASGEITVRESLVKHLRLVLNVRVDVARSDAEFERVRGSAMGGYAFVVLDAWTWAAKGWVPKPNLRGQEHKVFLLDFFGAEQPTRRGINVPASRILTAFPTFPGNTFLGYAIDKAQLPNTAPGGLLVSKPKKPQGVIWGKDPKHYSGRELVLKAVADVAPLYSTLSVRDAPSKLRAHPNIHFLGHQTKEKWQELLAESMFMLGLGNPLVGPSAVDAVVAGCVYVNPVYDKPVKDVYLSQHPYLEDRVGAPHVCSSKLSDIPAVVSCVRYAVANEVLPLIPAELTEAAYQSRVEDIFAPFVPKPAG